MCIAYYIDDITYVIYHLGPQIAIRPLPSRRGQGSGAGRGVQPRAGEGLRCLILSRACSGVMRRGVCEERVQGTGHCGVTCVPLVRTCVHAYMHAYIHACIMIVCAILQPSCRSHIPMSTPVYHCIQLHSTNFPPRSTNISLHSST